MFTATRETGIFCGLVDGLLVMWLLVVGLKPDSLGRTGHC